MVLHTSNTIEQCKRVDQCGYVPSIAVAFAHAGGEGEHWRPSRSYAAVQARQRDRFFVVEEALCQLLRRSAAPSCSKIKTFIVQKIEHAFKFSNATMKHR